MIRRLGAPAALLAGLGWLVLRVEALRREALFPEPGTKVWFPTFKLEEEATLTSRAAYVVALLMLVWIGSGLWLARKNHPGGTDTGSTLGAMFAPIVVGFAAITVLRTNDAFDRAMPSELERVVDHLDISEVLLTNLHTYTNAISNARIAVLALGALGSVVTLFVAGRRTEPSSLRVAVAVLCAGAVAFYVTRDRAFDATHPPTAWKPHDRTSLSPEVVDSLVLGPSSCTSPQQDAPILVLMNDGTLHINGMAWKRDEVQQDLSEYRQAWRRLNPSAPFSGVVNLALPHSTDEATLWRLVQQVEEAGFIEIDFLVREAPEPVATRTLGDLRYEARTCSIRTPLPATFPRGKTWGEMHSVVKPY
jgi:hypothetical protein